LPIEAEQLATMVFQSMIDHRQSYIMSIDDRQSAIPAIRRIAFSIDHRQSSIDNPGDCRFSIADQKQRAASLLQSTIDNRQLAIIAPPAAC
jgi:hypothetical protein